MKIVINTSSQAKGANKVTGLTEVQRKILLEFIAAHNAKLQKMINNGTYDKWLNKSNDKLLL